MSCNFIFFEGPLCSDCTNVMEVGIDLSKLKKEKNMSSGCRCAHWPSQVLTIARKRTYQPARLIFPYAKSTSPHSMLRSGAPLATPPQPTVLAVTIPSRRAPLPLASHRCVAERATLGTYFLRNGALKILGDYFECDFASLHIIVFRVLCI
jgi:hypothetical protein